MSKIVNVSQIYRKSLQDWVTQYDWGYTVKSGQSGNTYRVIALETGGYLCTCKWGEHRPDEDPKSACHHVMAVVRHFTATQGYNVAFIGMENTQVLELGDGVTVLLS